MAEIIKCPGCGAEIPDDCGNCLLCGKKMKAGAHQVVSAANEEAGKVSGDEKISASDAPSEIRPQPKKRSSFETSSFINGGARRASAGAFIIMIISAIIGFLVAVALSIAAGFSAMVPFVGSQHSGPHAEEIIFLFAFAFLAANAVTGGNLGYRAGRHIASALGMDVGGGPGVSSNFLWGGYAGGFLCAILFALFMRNPLTFGVSGTGLNFLFTFLIACVISVIAGNYLAITKNRKYHGTRESSRKLMI